MSRQAWAYIWGVLLSGAAISTVAFLSPAASMTQWSLFLALCPLTIFAHLFETEAPGRQSFYPHFVFILAGVFLLPPFLFVLLVSIPHLVEWAKERITGGPHLRSWYIQPFNIAGHIIAGTAAYIVNSISAPVALTDYTAETLLWAIAALLAYVFINHALVGLALVLARGLTWDQSKVLTIDSLLPDFTLSCLGYVVAVLAKLSPWLTLPALTSMVLLYRALNIPQLKYEAQVDGKTGLLNARYFTSMFATEIERAKRFSRPMTLIMADLDLLRNVNNTYGHLAGDAVLAGIGRIIRENIRTYDIAGRFGGEEFVIALPETGPDAGRLVAERIRTAVEAAEFEVETSAQPISVTMSLGVTCFPDNATDSTALIHDADVAVYQAKLRGRNRVICAWDVAEEIKNDSGPLAMSERLGEDYSAGLLVTSPLARDDS